MLNTCECLTQLLPATACRWIWAFYLSPFSWCIRSMCILEYGSPRWDVPVRLGGQEGRYSPAACLQPPASYHLPHAARLSCSCYCLPATACLLLPACYCLLLLTYAAYLLLPQWWTDPSLAPPADVNCKPESGSNCQTCQTLGLYALCSVNMFQDYGWVWAGVGYLVGA